MKKLIILSVMIALIPAFAMALDKPSAEQTRRVMDYYNEGKGMGAVLVEYKLCGEMGKEEENKNECAQSLAETDISVGQDVYLWMNFMIPVDDTANVFITYTRNSRIRKSQTVVLKSAFRYRTWKKIATDKPGDWTVKIFQETEDKDIDLGSLTYTVKE